MDEQTLENYLCLNQSLVIYQKYLRRGGEMYLRWFIRAFLFEEAYCGKILEMIYNRNALPKIYNGNELKNSLAKDLQLKCYRTLLLLHKYTGNCGD